MSSSSQDWTLQELQALAQRFGIGEAYYDHRGALNYFSDEARWAVLKAMGVPAPSPLMGRVEDASSTTLDVSLNRPSANAGTALAGVGQESHSTGRGEGVVVGTSPQTLPPLSSSLPPGERGTGIAENSCYRPPHLANGKSWGVSVQLYTLRSMRNWGIGDFADLRELIDLIAPLGCDVIGLNPLHALFPASPGLCSPYSPSSRTFLNFLYIAIDEIPEFASCDEALALVNQPPFQAALAAVRATDVVMYEQVATLKMCVLRLLHQQWLANASTIGVQRMRAFHDFVEQGGDALRSHALFDALDAQFRPQGMHGWHQWPVEFRDPRGAATVAFAQHNDDQVSFYLYAQWLAHEQLGHAQRHAIDRGMRIGLYGDLAVGANPDGAEVWADQSLYVQGIAVGAPPDPLALGGQDWGIPPMNPAVLRATAMQPMRELLRANMRYSGALRIDHVMSLFRLWWVPRGMSAVQGVYVHYPLDELMQCVVETSNAARCLVIGEDLGTVPDEVRDAMARHVLFHYKVLLFEKRDGNFIAPSDYVRESIATATTHDLPPLRAWWEELDLNLREGLRLYPNGTIAAQLRQERDHDRRALLRALRDANLWHWQDHDPLPEFSFALSRAIHLYLGQAQAALVLIQLEDLIGMTDPVNVPGTHIEHANWQRKIATITTDIFAKEEVREMLLALNQARAGMSPSGN